MSLTVKQQFPERPCVVAYAPWEEKSGLWYFKHAWHYGSDLGAGRIPDGFETDFGSIPSWLRSFVDDDDPRALCPFMRHDHRYATGALLQTDADQELYDGCIACGMSRVKAWLIYRAVRMFGGSHYKTK